MKVNISAFLAKSLIDAYSQLSENPNQAEWNSIQREDVFEYIRLVTGESDLVKAVGALTTYYSQNQNREDTELNSNVPDDLQKLVSDYEDFLKSGEIAKARASRNKFLYDLRAIELARKKASIAPTEKFNFPEIKEEVQQKKINLQIEAKSNPQEFSKKLSEQIKDEEAAKVFVDALIHDAPIEFLIEAELAKDNSVLVQQIVRDSEATKPFAEVFAGRVQKTQEIKNKVSGAIDPEVVSAVIPEIPQTQQSLFTLTEKPVKGVPSVLIDQRIFDEVRLTSIPPEPSLDYEPSGGFAPTQAFVTWGVKEMAKSSDPEDKAKATGLVVAMRKASEKEFRNLEIVALARGISPDSVKIVKDTFIAAKSKNAPWWLTSAIASYRAGLDPQTVNVMIGATGFVPEAALPQQGFFGRIVGGIGQQVMGKVSKGLIDGALKKVTGTVVEKAAVAAGTKIAAQAVGTTIPVIGNLLAWIGTEVVSRFLPWLKRNLGKVLMGIGGLIGLAGIVLGSLPLAGIGGAVFGGGAVVSAGGVAGAGSVMVGTISTFFGGLIATTISAFIAPFLIAVVIIPIAIGLILFIINSGAYVVPPATNNGLINQGLVASGTCPVLGNVKLITSSYDPATETGHGSNSYWPSGTACNYGIPIPGMYPGCNGPNIAGSEKNVCSKESQVCPYYGFAADFQDLPGGQNGADVALPFLCEAGNTSCAPLTWTARQFIFNCAGQAGDPATCTNSWGWLGIFTASANGNNEYWKIDLNHVDFSIPTIAGKTYASGTIVGKRAATQNHVHVELNIAGIPVKPDFLCSGQGSVGAWTGGQIPASGYGTSGWVVAAPASTSNLITTSGPSEYGQKTCDWANGKNLAFSNNANFGYNSTSPIGPFGFNGNIANIPPRDGTDVMSLVVDKSGNAHVYDWYGRSGSRADIRGKPDLNNASFVVTGVYYDNFKGAFAGALPRTAIGIKGNILYIANFVATPDGTKKAMANLGIDDGHFVMLDGDSVSQLCQNNTLLFPVGPNYTQANYPRAVSVSMGVKIGQLQKISP